MGGRSPPLRLQIKSNRGHAHLNFHCAHFLHFNAGGACLFDLLFCWLGCLGGSWLVHGFLCLGLFVTAKLGIHICCSDMKRKFFFSPPERVAL